VCICVRVYVRLCERERGRERVCVNMCVYVCVCDGVSVRAGVHVCGEIRVRW